MAEHAGNHWYKCDLHLHTMYSRCYSEKEDTAKDWVAKALEAGLDAVAVTDHNDYRGIGEMMEEGKKQGLAVFPGVEITCDTSKIHMLILFDTDKKAENVRDFLNRCDIDSDNVGNPDGTSLGVFEVCEIAKKRGAMVIAAHIDEFNSINSMNPANLEKLLSGGYIDAVQVSNVPVWRKLQADKDMEAMQQTLAEKYGADATPQEVDRWRKCFNLAEKMQLPMLAFSDNPVAPDESKHGLWGIGSVYTWIQMDDVVNLESIRQSLLTADSRIRMMYDSETEPKSEPDFWIRSIEVRNSTLNPYAPIRFDFHPQLNCIIGGKGSGKSSVVRIMLGVGRQLSGTLLWNTQAEQDRFYSRENEDNSGIFHEDSEIEVCYHLYGIAFKMLVSDIKTMDDQKYTFWRLDPETGEEIPVEHTEMLQEAFMHAQVFVQKQINEITQTPGALLDFTDRSIDGMYMEKARRDYYLEQLVNLSSWLNTAGRFLGNEERVHTEHEWYEMLKNMEGLPEDLQEGFTAGLEKRNLDLQQIEACKNQRKIFTKQKEELLGKYQASLEEIRKLRTGFISRVFENDENYKMELAPRADRDSFYTMQKALLAGDDSLMADDLKKLESALFAEENAGEQYVKLLLSVREGDADGFSAYFTHLIRKLPESDFERMLLFRPEDELRIFYHPNGVKRFYPLTNASSGEKATAIFSFILASTTAPLIVDQPEDDIDNRVVYEEIVPKLKRIKMNRQLIIVTHNANIAVNADPEMILVMDSRSKYARVLMKGSVDNDAIRNEICDILEGTEEGFAQRARKYHI